MLLSLASKFFPRLYQDQPGKGLSGDKCKAAPWTWDGAEIEPGLLGHSRWQEWNGKARKDLKKLDLNLMWWRKKGQTFVFFTFCEALQNLGPCHMAWAAAAPLTSSPTSPHSTTWENVFVSKFCHLLWHGRLLCLLTGFSLLCGERQGKQGVRHTGRGVRNASKARRETCQAPCERQGTADLQMITAQISASPSRRAFAELCGN